MSIALCLKLFFFGYRALYECTTRVLARLYPLTKTAIARERSAMQGNNRIRINSYLLKPWTFSTSYQLSLNIAILDELRKLKNKIPDFLKKSGILFFTNDLGQLYILHVIVTLTTKFL
jgi:hypothetical protein